MLSLEEVIDAVKGEHAYQDRKWGEDKQQSLPGYIMIMDKKIRDASDGWTTDATGRDSALSEVLQVVAVGIRCLQTYGVTGWAVATNDQPMNHQPAPHPTPTYSSHAKVITLTLQSGDPVHIGKAVFLTCYANPFGSQSHLTTVETLNGKVQVLESPSTIQAMIQG